MKNIQYNGKIKSAPYYLLLVSAARQQLVLSFIISLMYFFLIIYISTRVSGWRFKAKRRFLLGEIIHKHPVFNWERAFFYPSVHMYLTLFHAEVADFYKSLESIIK